MNEQGWLSGWRLTAARILMLLVVVAISVYIFSIRDEVEQLAAYGYPGLFLLSILANATVILPAPGIALTFAAGALFSPFLVALTAGAGATIGELTGYMAGFSGRGIAQRSDAYRHIEKWTQRYGGLAVLILAFIPNPFFDLAGAAAGALGMPIASFLLWALIGKVLKMLLFAYAGAASIDWLSDIMN